MWCASALFLLTPMIVVLGTVIGMKNAFATLGGDGVGDPSALSEHIGKVLTVTAWSLMIWLPTFIFLIISIIQFFCCRAKLRDLPCLSSSKA